MAKSNNLIQEKSFAFAIRVIKLYKFLCEEKKEFVLSKQLLRSGTSIGANVEESIGGQSIKDSVMKLSISYKETRESIYWIKLLKATDFLTKEQFQSIYNDAVEIQRILTKILLTAKTKNNS